MWIMVLCSVRAPSQECCRNNVECQRGGAGWVPAAEVYLGNWTEGQKKKKRSGKEPRLTTGPTRPLQFLLPTRSNAVFFPLVFCKCSTWMCVTYTQFTCATAKAFDVGLHDSCNYKIWRLCSEHFEYFRSRTDWLCPVCGQNWSSESWTSVCLWLLDEPGKWVRNLLFIYMYIYIYQS